MQLSETVATTPDKKQKRKKEQFLNKQVSG